MRTNRLVSDLPGLIVREDTTFLYKVFIVRRRVRIGMTVREYTRIFFTHLMRTKASIYKNEGEYRYKSEGEYLYFLYIL